MKVRLFFVCGRFCPTRVEPNGDTEAAKCWRERLALPVR
jgi:hypothetical protein